MTHTCTLTRNSTLTHSLHSSMTYTQDHTQVHDTHRLTHSLNTGQQACTFDIWSAYKSQNSAPSLHTFLQNSRVQTNLVTVTDVAMRYLCTSKRKNHWNCCSSANSAMTKSTLSKSMQPSIPHWTALDIFYVTSLHSLALDLTPQWWLSALWISLTIF